MKALSPMSVTGRLDALRVVIASVDDDEVFDPAGDVQRSVEVHAKVTGSQPKAVHRTAFGVAAVFEL